VSHTTRNASDTELAKALLSRLERFRNLLKKAIRGLTGLYCMDEFLLSKQVVHGMWITLQAHWSEVDAEQFVHDSASALKTAYSHFEKEFTAVPTVASSCFVDTSGGYDGLEKLKEAESALVSVMHVLECEFGLMPF